MHFDWILIGYYLHLLAYIEYCLFAIAYWLIAFSTEGDCLLIDCLSLLPIDCYANQTYNAEARSIPSLVETHPDSLKQGK